MIGTRRHIIRHLKVKFLMEFKAYIATRKKIGDLVTVFAIYLWTEVCFNYIYIFFLHFSLNVFFRQIKSFIRFCLAFTFGLQTSMDFTKIYQKRVWSPKQKAKRNLMNDLIWLKICLKVTYFFHKISEQLNTTRIMPWKMKI